jgi:predicted Fe-Mo cluster-binding NifX family protein
LIPHEKIGFKLFPLLRCKGFRMHPLSAIRPSRDIIQLLNFYRFAFDDFKGRLRHTCCVAGGKNILADWILAVMRTIAIPIFKSRVSPVFDTCTRLLLIDFDDNLQLSRKEFDLDNFSLHERLQVLEKNAVTVIICGGISDVFHAILSNSNIQLISGICGNINEVIKAHIEGRLDDPCFFMPGYKACNPK